MLCNKKQYPVGALTEIPHKLNNLGHPIGVSMQCQIWDMFIANLYVSCRIHLKLSEDGNLQPKGHTQKLTNC